MALFAQGHALVIGVGTYEHAQQLDVPLTEQDAAEVARVLLDEQLCGYPPDQVTLLTGAAATRDAVLAALDRLAERVTADDTVVVFYSGHGDRGPDRPDGSRGTYYLTTADTRVEGNRIAEGSGVSQEELLQKVNAIPARRALLIFNACYAGAVVPGALDAAAQRPVGGLSLPDEAAEALLGTGEGRVVITACGERQKSLYDWDEPTTVFGEELVGGLRGAQGMRSRRGYISVFDLYEYLYDRVSTEVPRRWPEWQQEPELTVRRGKGAMAVALYRGQVAAAAADATPLPEERPQTLPGRAREIAPEEAEAAAKRLVPGITLIAPVTIHYHYPNYGDVTPKPVDPVALAAARAQLAALPIDTIPEPAPVPHGPPLPPGFTRNAIFVGRAADLQALARGLNGDAAGLGPCVAVTGMGGLGKTQLANEFVHCYGRYFAGGVVWLDFAQPDSIPTQIAACRPTVTDPAVALKLVLGEWQSALPRLLVFDNCEEEALLRRWRPPASGCRVLVTSRRALYARDLGVRRLPLGVLSTDESMDLLREHCPDTMPDDADLRALAEYLDGLPLALHIAGSFLASYGDAYTPAAYLHELRSRPGIDHKLLTGEGLSPTGHVQSVWRTFELSYERLRPDDVVDWRAVRLLARAAHFAAGVPIPRPLLRLTIGVADDDRSTIMEATRALRRLVDLGLVEEAGTDTVRMHRLVATFVRAVAQDATAHADVEASVLRIARELNQAGDPRPLLALQPHLRAVVDAALPRADEQAANLGNELAYHLSAIGDFAGARPYLEQALAIREEVLGEEHPDTATTLDHLGTLLQEQGDLDAAKPCLEQALAIREEVLGPRHPDTATSLDHLGVLLRKLGDLEQALEVRKQMWDAAKRYLERALAIREEVLGPRHPDTVRSRNNLAALDARQRSPS